MKVFEQLLEIANRDIKRFEKEIVVTEVDNLYNVDVRSKVGAICVFAYHIEEGDVAEYINDAWANVRVEAQRESSEFIVYQKVHGWTHDLPALIFCNTNIPLFFYDEFSKTVESVDENEAGIDGYNGRCGYFVVLEEDYELAMKKVEEHDKEAGLTD